MLKSILVVSLFICWAQSAPQWFHFDTPRTGSEWPPYPNAGKDYWQVEAEKLENQAKVKKSAVLPEKTVEKLNINEKEVTSDKSKPEKVQEDQPRIVK